MLAPMGLLFDSFWRAVAYCARPRVIVLSLLPLLCMALLAGGLGYFYWGTAVQGVQAALETTGWLSSIWGWLRMLGVSDAPSVMAPLLVVVAATPIVVVVSLLIVAVLMAPALVNLVAERRFPSLERKKGGSLLLSIGWSLGSTLLALVALVVSMPLWLVPPLVLVLPPLIWGWLTYRVMAFDALAEHASKDERRKIFSRYRWSLMGIGVVSGYLGAAPGIVWASGVVFAAAFLVLVPVAIWIYTLVFAFSSLWFAHFCLAALQQLRQEGGNLAAAPAAAPAAEPVALPSGPGGPSA
ncbi:EI24 domain-containing protein [Paenacidovorax monticola]|uniref:EI24 domain-containing protein n=2 Tax=Paenacidovorax monticola TaxID=1926868 RepID=A0A7H0HJG1_9BURK|nr:EI24 domain-containing protein [Paenacidovorax monticola]